MNNNESAAAQSALRDGFTKVPNWFIEDLFSHPAVRPPHILVLLFVWRKLVGYHDTNGRDKEYDFIALSQIQKATGTGKRQAWEASNLWKSVGLFRRVKCGARGIARFSLNPDLSRETVLAALNQLPAVPERNRFLRETGSREKPEPVSQRNSTGSPEEPTKETQSKNEKKPAADRAAVSASSTGKAADPRFRLVKESYIQGFEKQSGGVKADFDASDGKALKTFLHSHPELSAVRIAEILGNAFASEYGPLGKHFRLRQFCSLFGRYLDGPLKLNRFDQPQQPTWQKPQLGYAAQQRAKAAKSS